MNPLTQDEMDFLKALAQKGLAEQAYENKIKELDVFRQDLYARGEKKEDVDLTCKDLEDEVVSLRGK